MKAEFTKEAVKTLKSMDGKMKQRIRSAIEKIPQGDIKPLEGSGTLYRVRVGGMRVVFSYESDDTILIYRIAPRGDVYKGGLL